MAAVPGDWGDRWKPTISYYHVSGLGIQCDDINGYAEWRVRDGDLSYFELAEKMTLPFWLVACCLFSAFFGLPRLEQRVASVTRESWCRASRPFTLCYGIRSGVPYVSQHAIGPPYDTHRGEDWHSFVLRYSVSRTASSSIAGFSDVGEISHYSPFRPVFGIDFTSMRHACQFSREGIDDIQSYLVCSCLSLSHEWSTTLAIAEDHASAVQSQSGGTFPFTCFPSQWI